MRPTRLAILAAFCVGCMSTTEPHTRNLDLAYAQWTDPSRPTSYKFDLTIGAFAPSQGPVHVTVTNGQVASARNASGALITGFTFTIDTLWVRVLSTRQSGTLNSADFTLLGVPTDVDMGDWALDGGVHYSVRNFAFTR